MKTLKSIMLGLALLVVSTVANATIKPAQSVSTTAALSKNDVLNIYVNAVIHGKIEGVETILAKDVQFTMYRGEKEFKLDKTQLLESLKSSENVEQGCTYSTSIMDESDNKMVVKLTMKYDGYVRTNLVTIALNRSDFQITKIETQS